MGATTMAGKKSSGKKSGESPGPDDEVKVNCYPAERDLINKVAGARGQKVADFFRSKDVRTFLTHLLVAAAQSEAERQEVPPPPGT